MNGREGQIPAMRPVGEDGLLVEYEPRVAPEVNRKVRRLAAAIERLDHAAIAEVVSAHRSLMVYYNPDRIQPAELESLINKAVRHSPPEASLAPRTFEMPTCYGGKCGPDLDAVSSRTGLDCGEVVRMFSETSFQVSFIGFLCGLAYLMGVPKPLHLPRRTSPRTSMPAGSVGLAHEQAVTLPIDQPSGWHFIGRTFVTVYDPGRNPPTPLRPEDRIRFPAVGESTARLYEGKPIDECIV